MSIGTIIFIIGIIITIGQSVVEKMGKKEDAKPIVRKLQNFEKRVQQNIDKIEQTSESYKPAQRKAREVVKEASPRLVQEQKKARPERMKAIDPVEKVLTDKHLTQQQKAHRLEAIKSQDLTETDGFKFEITNENLVHSLIMAELLAPPKSKR
ncbi:hypothetical protein [Macrococcus brunensis]|uniref:hypothetical protein n=1 Tax=Macrococcus brunensis TaxID=198483 RepID=UPI001EF1058E|nr:hypothetical protein [Macrococcus brunensis]ULG71130.1 hypothetical protein MGG12_07185 [Macrococcus brunensis]ULG73465.1 hypothetical protein MGG13_07035 [Macrococcus brunensis]